MIELEDNKGFNCCEIIEQENRKLNIGIIDADLLDGGTRHPNLSLLKISGYCKSFGHKVRLIQSYDEIVSEGKIIIPGRNRQTLWGGRMDANPKLLLNDTCLQKN